MVELRVTRLLMKPSLYQSAVSMWKVSKKGFVNAKYLLFPYFPRVKLKLKINGLEIL